MKKLLIIITTIALSSIVNAEVRYVTLKAQGKKVVNNKYDYGYPITDEVTLDPSDLVEIVDASSGEYLGLNNVVRGELQVFLKGDNKPKRYVFDSASHNQLSGCVKIRLTFDENLSIDRVNDDYSSSIILRITTKSCSLPFKTPWTKTLFNLVLIPTHSIKSVGSVSID